MILITKQLLKQFSKIGDQSESENPIIIAKFFTPSGSATWYVSEYNPKTNICFGYVVGLGTNEWGYFSLTELKTIRCKPFGLPIERDRWFDEKLFFDLGLEI